MEENFESPEDFDFEQNNEAATSDTEKREKNFEALKSLLRTDMKVKEDLLRSVPSPADDFDTESRIEYTDRLDSLLKDFKVELELISNGFEFGESVTNAINEFVANTRQNLEIGKYEPNIISNLYQQNFSGMDPKFVEEVKDRCKGYTGSSPELLADLFGKATTVNEMLHAMHSFVMNNEQIMGTMPQISEKKNSSDYPITLYGEPSEIATEIFENFPHELDVGWTDIISMQNKVFMMVRDRGHALTIDIDTSREEEIDVKYFIPKLCNEEMIRALKGIDASHITPSGARGGFTVAKEEITDELFGFIEKVPTDLDIPSVRSWYEQSQNGLPLEQEEITVSELTIHEPEQAIFSSEQAKELATQPERKFGKIKDFATRISNLFDPLVSKFKDNKSQDSKDDNVK